MERIKSLPIIKRFSIKLFIFLLVLFFSFSYPLWIINKGNYKTVTDRSKVQKELLNSIITLLTESRFNSFDNLVSYIPKVLQNQRVFIFSPERDLIYDSGVISDIEFSNSYRTFLPHPYITNHNSLSKKNRDHIRVIGELDRLYGSNIMNVKSRDGLDRVITHGAEILWNNNSYILVLSSSVVDILLQNRAIKERFLLTYLLIIMFSAILAIILGIMVIYPFNKLYTFSHNLLNKNYLDAKPFQYHFTGGIGEISKAISELILSQKSMADNFKTFSSDVVHELKTPLSAIRTGMELYVESTDQEEKSRIEQMMARRIQSMESLMDDINELGKVEFTVLGNSITTDLDLQILLKNLKENFTLIFNITMDFCNIIIPIDKGKLLQVLNNIISNAISFSPEENSVIFTLTSNTKEIIFTIDDSGPGIPEEIISKITERFYSFRPNNHGDRHSGLGLSIVKVIVDNSRGSLLISNRITGGARFQVKLPLLNSSDIITT